MFLQSRINGSDGSARIPAAFSWQKYAVEP